VQHHLPLQCVCNEQRWNGIRQRHDLHDKRVPNTHVHHSGSSITEQVFNLRAMGNTKAADELMKEWPSLFPTNALATVSTTTTSPGTAITLLHNHHLRDQGPEILSLQHYLNTHGFPVTATGPGSLGNETPYFGLATKAALVNFQKAHSLPATGYLGPLTRALINNSSPDGAGNTSATTTP